MLSIALLAATSTLSDPDNQDMVNERPPLTAQALEAHWGVDCNALVETVAGLTDRELERKSGGVPAIGEVAGLCAVIYNSPDRSWYRRCPDYARLQRTIAEHGEQHSATTVAELNEAISCQ